MSSLRDNSRVYRVLDEIGMPPAAMQKIIQTDYVESHAWKLEQLLELVHVVSDIAPFVNCPLLEKCAARTRELHRHLVDGRISYDYVYHTLKQEFGNELSIKP